jgi:hypothetical protein
MKNRLIATLITILVFSSFIQAQGPFVGASLDKKGNVGLKAGWSYMSVTEASVSYAPKSLNEAGFIGGSLKIPVKFDVLKENYLSSFFWGIFLSYTGGVIQFPEAPASAGPLSKSTKYGGAPSVSLEVSWIGSGFAMAFPIELGYGKLNFNQDFPNQFNYTENKYVLASSLYLSLIHI